MNKLYYIEHILTKYQIEKKDLEIRLEEIVNRERFSFKDVDEILEKMSNVINKINIWTNCLEAVKPKENGSN